MFIKNIIIKKAKIFFENKNNIKNENQKFLLSFDYYFENDHHTIPHDGSFLLLLFINIGHFTHKFTNKIKD